MPVRPARQGQPRNLVQPRVRQDLRRAEDEKPAHGEPDPEGRGVAEGVLSWGRLFVRLETFLRSAYGVASSGAPAMRRLLPALLTVTCVLAAATDALACRMIVPRAGELAQRAIIIATVKNAERVEAPGWNTWRVVAENASEAERSANRSTFEFTTTLSSDGCGQTPLPPLGEHWVLYVDQADPSKVLDAFPLDYVRDYDVRLADVR